MGSPETRHPWTLCGLIEAFVGLALAYFLLCVSTFAFFASKFLGIVGLRLPCFCTGVLGYQSIDLCWHRLLIDWPVGKIHEVQLLAKSRFPFDSIQAENELDLSNKLSRDEKTGSCSSSISGLRNQNLVDRESGCEAKGKRIVTPKQRSGLRRRRRATLAYGKFASIFPSDSLALVDFVKFGESSGLYSGKEYGPRDDVSVSNCGFHEEELCHSAELSGLIGSNDSANNSICFEKHMKDTEEIKSFVGSESERIRMLERALEEEKAACSALYLELEKERASAATAADEAMAMISRLQNDKASMEVEARQYERIIEEKFAYDEEEIDILKEILVRKERDNHILEKEIETYRRMSITGDDQSNDDISETTLDDLGQRPIYSPHLSSEPHPILHYTNSFRKHLKNDVDFPLSHEVPFVDKQSQCDEHELIEKAVILVDHVDHTVMLDSVPEDMNEDRDIVDES